MAMRQDCKHFESQTFTSGETLSKCILNLAPEAPWRCPTNCSSYERRRVNVNLEYQNIVSEASDEIPSSIEENEAIADLLANVASIVDEAAPGIVKEVEKEAQRNKGWRKMVPRKKSSNKKRKNRNKRKRS